ncbi:CocE/NonD family hydrolase [Erwinia endophytica]|uniref:CocE/NonD family hydrolase n=1 Tax=Erwinia endophytica TaxID=1563158 RepID=UPI001265EAC2|nr:CocE/NonD family hydrolase [Erwinia endophytica]KAB8309944.1 CocE/NonD family hydrolase [Erwinia endophytica]
MRIIETAWITLSDGCRLAARIWLPESDDPVPAVLEYLPYRRRDRHRGDDAILHPALAACGYAAVRVDMRGAGDSDGTMNDEYTPQEWADACETIAWIAAQPWCSGAVGMVGISWSGFNALQIAALRPPALKAIVTTCSTDDRFADDMHYMGGALLNDNLQYGATLFTWTPTPPDPLIVGDRWKTLWLARLAAMDIPPAARWMSHPTRDAYWQSGSVCEDYHAIEVPVLAVGGWADGYSNTILRLLEELSGPRKGLIGPWGHAFPHVATPGPRIDFIRYLQRWFDHWLKGQDSGLMDEPMLTYWMQQAETPRTHYENRLGHWTAEAAWPSPALVPQIWYLAAQRLHTSPVGAFAVSVRSPATTGLASGEWCPYGSGPDMPGDQYEDDAGSCCFDSPPLDAPRQIVGQVQVELRLTADTPQALVAVRLNAVAADGSSIRISYGLLNLAHRHGHHPIQPLPPGEEVVVSLALKAAAFEIPAGYRLRLAVSSSYWPLAAPYPWLTRLTLHAGRIMLPLRQYACAAPDLGEGWAPPPLDAEVLTPAQRGRLRLTRDMANGDTTLEVVRNLGALHLNETDLRLEALGHEHYRINPLHPANAHAEAVRHASFLRGDWHASVDTRSVLTCDDNGWWLDSTLEARDGETLCFSRQWRHHFPFAAAGREQG